MLCALDIYWVAGMGLKYSNYWNNLNPTNGILRPNHTSMMFKNIYAKGLHR